VPSPSWDQLFHYALAQEGHFTTEQAAAAGYSPQLLAKYLANGRVRRVRRGVYRIVHFPPGAHEELVTLWLWSEKTCVFSHDTALMLHGLSNAVPTTVTITLPYAWSKRRLRVPEQVVAHYADVMPEQRVAIGAIPATNISRTLSDCSDAGVSLEHIDQTLGPQAVRTT